MSATSIRLFDGSIFNITGEGIIPQGNFIDAQGDRVDVLSNSVFKLAITIGALCNAASIVQKVAERSCISFYDMVI